MYTCVFNHFTKCCSFLCIVFHTLRMLLAKSGCTEFKCFHAFASEGLLISSSFGVCSACHIIAVAVF